MSEIYAGRIDLNPNCIGLSSEFAHMSLDLTKRVQNILKVVFFRLGHNMRIYVVETEPTSVISDHADPKEVQEIKNIVNIVFFTYFEHDYNAITTLKCLEECKFIPPAKIYS